MNEQVPGAMADSERDLESLTEIKALNSFEIRRW